MNLKVQVSRFKVRLFSYFTFHVTHNRLCGNEYKKEPIDKNIACWLKAPDGGNNSVSLTEGPVKGQTYRDHRYGFVSLHLFHGKLTPGVDQSYPLIFSETWAW